MVRLSVPLERPPVESGELLAGDGCPLPNLRQEALPAGRGEQCGRGFRAEQPFGGRLRQRGGGGRGSFAAEQREHREHQGAAAGGPFAFSGRAFPLESARPLSFARFLGPFSVLIVVSLFCSDRLRLANLHAGSPSTRL